MMTDLGSFSALTVTLGTTTLAFLMATEKAIESQSLVYGWRATALSIATATLATLTLISASSCCLASAALTTAVVGTGVSSLGVAAATAHLCGVLLGGFVLWTHIATAARTITPVIFQIKSV